MQKQLEVLQPSADAIAMTAAVSDFRRKGGGKSNKISKALLLDSLSNTFETVPDLLVEIVSRRQIGQVFLGFAALTGDDAEIESLGKEKRLQKGCAD